MKKYILVIIIHLLSISIYAQVYLSKIYNDVLVLGPNNVAPHCDAIANSYVGDIENLYDLLLNEQVQLEANITAYNGIENPTKAQQFVASDQQEDIKLIEQELTILMQFKELWLRIKDQSSLKLELVDIIKSNQCATIETNYGEFSTNEYMLTIDKNLKRIKIVEHFGIEQRDSIAQWVTKVSEHCASSDPNDCMMWCYINQPAGNVLVDITNDVYILDNSLLANEYTMNFNNNSCSRELVLDLDGETVDVVNVVKSDSNMLLQLESFTTVECTNK